jgi:hypothetical protein
MGTNHSNIQEEEEERREGGGEWKGPCLSLLPSLLNQVETQKARESSKPGYANDFSRARGDAVS